MNDIYLSKNIWKQFNPQQLKVFKRTVFEHYRNKGFPYFRLSPYDQLSVFKKLSNFDIRSLKEDNLVIGQNMLGLNLINYFMPHMWETKCNKFTTPLEAFNDDALFKKAIDKRIKFGDNISDAGIRKVLSWVQGTHRVSNFRPTVAKYLYETYGGDNNLDFSSGFGGRLMGFMSSSNKVSKYFGFEPNLKTYNKLIKISEAFQHNKNITIVNEAFEDISLFPKSFDFSFSSPPYFNTEEYAYDDKQSFVRYKTKEEWRDNFLRVLINKNYQYLKDDGTFAINIADVKTYPKLEEDTLQISKDVGFKLIKTYKMSLSNLMGNGFKYEPIFIFKK